MSNKIKTFFLMFLLTVLFIWLGGMIGGPQGAFIALLMAAGMNFYALWMSDKMVLKRYRAQEVREEDNHRLYRIVSSLVAKTDLPMPKVYIIPEKNLNAFATGRNPKHAAVAATEGILEMLNDDELSGVMAHELTHIRKRDMLTGTVTATFAGAISMFSYMAPRGSSTSGGRSNPLVTLIIVILAPLLAILIKSMVSRVREYSADKGGAEISGKPLALASALAKISGNNKRYPLQRGSEADENLFIVNPFFGGFQKIMSTHPPTEERIRRLKEMATAYE
jgi:heat shock protein HtpX